MNKKYFITGVIIIAVLAGAVWAARQIHPLSGQAHESQRVWSKGPQGAPITLVEYSDFQCPACSYAVAAIEKIMKEFEGQVYFVYRHFPLSGHVWSEIAHLAAECGGRQGKFWEFHDRLYDKQKEWAGPKNPLETLMRYAKEEELDLDRFATCLTDEKVKAKVYEDRKLGEDLQVRSTPTFFVNGERFVGARQLSVKGAEYIESVLGLSTAEGGSDG